MIKLKRIGHCDAIYNRVSVFSVSGNETVYPIGREQQRWDL